ncbi:MAG: hypothetical protein LRY55_10335, partial [Leadbetterella sp.]|nr:hypothetical protein [Leadbetterella sp.]
TREPTLPIPMTRTFFIGHFFFDLCAAACPASPEEEEQRYAGHTAPGRGVNRLKCMTVHAGKLKRVYKANVFQLSAKIGNKRAGATQEGQPCKEIFKVFEQSGTVLPAQI